MDAVEKSAGKYVDKTKSDCAMWHKYAIRINLNEEDDDVDIELFGQNELFHRVPDIDQRLDENE